MTIAALTTALAVGGKVIGAVGAVQQGNANAAAADFNARIAAQQADAERDAAAAEARDYRRSESGKRAASRTARLASGVTMSGSSLLVDEAMVREAALGSARIVHGGAVRGHRLDQESALYRMNARNARTAGYLKAGSSLLSAGSSWAGSYN